MKFTIKKIVSQYKFKKDIEMILQLKVKGCRIEFVLLIVSKIGYAKEISFGSLVVSDISDNKSTDIEEKKLLERLFPEMILKINRKGDGLDFCLKSDNRLLSATLPYSEAKRWLVINQKRELLCKIEADKLSASIIRDEEFDIDDEDNVVAPRNLTIEQAWRIIEGFD